jgi:hypothetical protein
LCIAWNGFSARRREVLVVIIIRNAQYISSPP